MLEKSAIHRITKLVILDRDGVINFESQSFVKTPEEWIPIPGSLEAIADLSKKGFTVAVASNQSGIPRGYLSIESLNSIEQKMLESVRSTGGRIDVIAYCPHLPLDNCDCRKPKPGLLKAIAAKLGADLTNSIFIGDRQTDLDAATAVRALGYLIAPNSDSSAQNTLVFSDLRSAVEAITKT